VVQIAKHRIVLQQVRESSGVGQIVDGYEVDVRITEGCAKNISADPTETINTNLHRHGKNLLLTG